MITLPLQACYILRKSGQELSTMKEFLGHSDIPTTIGYTDEIMKYDQLDEAVDEAF